MSELIRLSQSRIVETRSSVQSITSPVEFYQPNQALYPKWDAARFVTNGYLEQTYVFSCVDKKSGTLARVPFRVGSDPDNPTSYRKNAQLAQLLGTGGKPAPGWTPRMWWKYIFSQFCIMGKFACQIERDSSGKVIALWPLQAQHLRPIPDTSKNPKSYFIGYQYGNPGAPGYKKFMALADVLYCWEPSPDDPRQPLSVIDAAKLDISVAQLINEYDYALLKNNAVPATIVTTEPFDNTEMRSAFRQQFMARFSGSNNAGKTMFLEADPDTTADGGTSNNVAGKISVERLGLSSQEMQSPEKRASTINDICVAFKTPLSILGDSTRSKFTNMESDYRNWWADTELPLADYVCDLINVGLSPQFDIGHNYVGWFDFSSIGALKEPPRFTGTEIVALEGAGILDRDESRRELGFAPWDDVTHPEMKELVPKDPATTPQPEISGNQSVDPIGLDPGQNNAPKNGLAVQRSIPSVLTKALQGTVRNSLEAQKLAVEQRINGRRKPIDSVRDVYDTEFWIGRMSKDLEPLFQGFAEFQNVPNSLLPTIVRQITTDSVAKLRSTASVEEAYNDIDARSEAIAQTVVRMLEEIPADHMAFILDAIKRGNMTPAQALEVIG